MKVMRFDEILPAVEHGHVDAGVLIHEGQLTYGRKKLSKAVDLGEWWTLEPAVQQDLAVLMKASTAYGLEHRKEVLPHAKEFTRGLSLSDTDRFVRMYVNTHTVEMSGRVQDALGELYRLASERRLLPADVRLDSLE